MVLMAVHAAHRNRNAVDAELSLIDGHGAKAQARRDRLHQPTRRIKKLEHQAIERGRLWGPGLGATEAPGQADPRPLAGQRGPYGRLPRYPNALLYPPPQGATGKGFE